jgi:hypothetical protein
MCAVHLRVGQTARGRVAGGFSLLEAVIAAALLLVTIAAVTVCAAGVSGAGARLEQRMDRDRVLRRLAERLGALPFCAGRPAQAGDGTGYAAGDLVAAVFPHARPAQNTPGAYFVAAGGDGTAPAGSFVTVEIEDGVPVTCVARFLVGPSEPALGASDLDDWDVAAGSPPPAPMLAITLAVEGDSRGVLLIRSAMDEASVAGPLATAGAG